MRVRSITLLIGLEVVKVWNVMYDYLMYLDPENKVKQLNIVNIAKLNSNIKVVLDSKEWESFEGNYYLVDLPLDNSASSWVS